MERMGYHWESKEITKDIHTTPHYKQLVRMSRTFWRTTQKKTLFFFLGGYQVLRMMTSSMSSSDTKMSVWREFKKSCEETGKQGVCCTKFTDLWQQFHPNVVVAKPMSDFCLTCQQNTCKLIWSANLPDREKSECVRAQQEHLNRVQTEREVYRRICQEAEINFKTLEEQIDLHERHEACSLDTTIHYSFDFAQQIHIPSNPKQPGPLYFKTPRKYGIFGVMCEAIPRQVNYLIDETSDVGKGANTTISYVHHYFQNRGLGETQVHLHANNCLGQNKNNYFIWYLAWRTIMHLHESINYSFLIADHTKCDGRNIVPAYNCFISGELFHQTAERKR